jgi:carbon monoxide dehydrogenase subunit G
VKIITSAAVVASREQVFIALNDRGILRRTIPGCEELTDIDENSFAVLLKVGVAGIKGKYEGSATRRDVKPPESLTLSLDGKGKTGFVRGTAAVTIVEAEGLARIDCEADVQIGGAIAAVGSRLIGAVAQKLTRDFFNRLAEEIGVVSVASDEDSIVIVPADEAED